MDAEKTIGIERFKKLSKQQRMILWKSYMVCHPSRNAEYNPAIIPFLDRNLALHAVATARDNYTVYKAMRHRHRMFNNVLGVLKR